MKAALAVMIELVLAGAPYGALFFPREELPQDENALEPLFERHPLRPDLALVMEPTDNTIHGGCLGNINAAWTFSGVSGHSARPWTAENAIERMAEGISHLVSHPAVPHEFDGLTFMEVASVTKVHGGIAMNVIPDTAEAHVNFRYAPGRTREEAEARLHELCGGHGELRIDSNAPSGAVSVSHPTVQRLIGLGSLEVAPKQAWTPVADFTLAGIPAVNFGPGAPAQAHRKDESVEIAALVRSYRLLEALAA
jgi:succinyl-diaminopimelate desuccinylase